MSACIVRAQPTVHTTQHRDTLSFGEEGTVAMMQTPTHPGGRASIVWLHTPLSQRGRGQARRCLARALAHADALGWALVLSCEPQDARTDPQLLRQLYASVGFRPAPREWTLTGGSLMERPARRVPAPAGDGRTPATRRVGLGPALATVAVLGLVVLGLGAVAEHSLRRVDVVCQEGCGP